MALSYGVCQTNAKGQELSEHGTALFPVACYVDHLPEITIPWHWHGEFEATFVIEGQATISTDAEVFTVRAGDAFFINAGALHEERSAEGCVLSPVVFHPRLVGGSIDSVFWQSFVQPLLGDRCFKAIHFDRALPWHDAVIQSIHDAWHACVNEPPGYPLAVRESLSKVVFQIAQYRSANIQTPSEKLLRDAARIKCMLQYIQEHLSEPLTIRQIAHSANISESECLRCFRATIGTTPIQYVKRFRVHRAAHLLTSTDEKIVQIGMQCGFQEMSYFSKIFRELQGCTPTEYRSQTPHHRSSQ